jgi:hypothetical protein
LKDVIRECQENNIDSLNLLRPWLPRESDFERVRNAGLALYVNVVKEPHLLRYINGFMTDYPAEMRALLQTALKEQE